MTGCHDGVRVPAEGRRQVTTPTAATSVPFLAITHHHVRFPVCDRNTVAANTSRHEHEKPERERDGGMSGGERDLFREPGNETEDELPPEGP